MATEKYFADKKGILSSAMRAFVVLLFVFLFLCVGCTAVENGLEISAKDVASVHVWLVGKSGDIPLDSAETATFIDLYNQSEYMGEANGNGGTPEWGVCVSFKNGDVLYINEFNGREDFEVSWYTAVDTKAWYYVNNPELLNYMAELLN